MDECNRRSLSPWRSFLPTPEWFAHRRRVRQLDDAIVDIIRARWRRKTRGESVPDDILERVLDQVDAKEYGVEVETQLCYEIKTFLLAGHETSAAMLTWTLYELVNNAAAMGRVKSEADRVFGKLKRDALPTRDSLASLEYSVAALKETLRLYSVVPVVTRVAVEDDDLGGVRVPAGTTVIMSLQGVHHRDDIWPDPLAYKPNDSSTRTRTRASSFCRSFRGRGTAWGRAALLEARVVLISLVKRYRFEHASGENAKKHTKAIPIAPAHGMHFTVS